MNWFKILGCYFNVLIVIPENADEAFIGNPVFSGTYYGYPISRV